jgi:protein tyrosine phosphatase (PTP) superfamily phosphohydrolase (DUF442 family)
VTHTARRNIAAALWGGPFLLGLLLVSLAAKRQEPPSGQPPAKVGAKIPERLDIAGIENAFRLSPRLYSGGDPHGEASFRALKALGVRTIVSVDGAPPDVKSAHEFGIRYVHLPIGYDGVPREQAVRLVQAVKTLPGPVYVHCHHGKHRGPAAAAVCGIALEGWSKDEALAWMEEAGTSPAYRGLYASACGFVLPTAEELGRVGADLPERAPVPAPVERMVQVDKRWDHLKDVQKAGFRPPADSPDLDPPHEALQLAELFRELVRLRDTKERDEEFLGAAEAAEHEATGLEAALRAFGEEPSADARKAVESAFNAVSRSCTSCHTKHRDN